LFVHGLVVFTNALGCLPLLLFGEAAGLLMGVIGERRRGLGTLLTRALFGGPLLLRGNAPGEVLASPIYLLVGQVIETLEMQEFLFAQATPGEGLFDFLLVLQNALGQRDERKKGE
jgi:hypothetical protein